MKYIGERTTGHIGKKTWSRLSYRQRNAIKKDRGNASKLAEMFIKEKDERLGKRRTDWKILKKAVDFHQSLV